MRAKANMWFAVGNGKLEFGNAVWKAIDAKQKRLYNKAEKNSTLIKGKKLLFPFSLFFPDQHYTPPWDAVTALKVDFDPGSP